MSGYWRLPRFFLLFGLAFFAYAFGWTGAYFALGGAAGEWIGSLAGSILMAVVFALGFGIVRSTLVFALILFAANSLGYFLGSALNDLLGGKIGMLSWGGSFGLFLGTALGAVLYYAQKSQRGSIPGPSTR